MMKGEVPIDRNEMLGHIWDNPDFWDCIIIGEGATGVGTAVDAASRGYKTLLLEQGDFAQGITRKVFVTVF